eukprot:COSAG01_NODE_23248_length_822_cov_1.159059_1_plen_188_part_00
MISTFSKSISILAGQHWPVRLYTSVPRQDSESPATAQTHSIWILLSTEIMIEIVSVSRPRLASTSVERGWTALWLEARTQASGWQASDLGLASAASRSTHSRSCRGSTGAQNHSSGGGSGGGGQCRRRCTPRTVGCRFRPASDYSAGSLWNAWCDANTAAQITPMLSLRMGCLCMRRYLRCRHGRVY